jgi:hypothetical protein
LLRIDACLDEFEATVDGVRRSKCKDPHELRFAKAWGNFQKITLRSLGYRKRLPVIGGSRVESGTLPPSDEPTDKEDIFEVFGKEK